MQYRSRLRKGLFRNTLVSIIAIILIIFFVGFFGIQVLVKLSLFLGNIKSIGEIPINSNNSVILPPMLDPLFEATNSAVIEITGRGTEPGQTIEIFVNGDYKTKALVDNDSEFTVPEFRLEQGENEIKAKAKFDNKESEFSPEQIVIYENTPPALEVKEPTSGQTIKKTRNIRVAGKTEADANVSVNGLLPIVDSNGNFSYMFPLKDGENVIKVVATDRAGNQTTNEIKVTFEP